MKTRFLIRAILRRSLAAIGYRISGNHVFLAADLAAIERGYYRYSVSENPFAHSAKSRRAAALLTLTFAS